MNQQILPVPVAAPQEEAHAIAGEEVQVDSLPMLVPRDESDVFRQPSNHAVQPMTPRREHWRVR